MTLKAWNLLNNMIRINNDKCDISLHFKHNNALIKDPGQIINTFCNFLTNIGPNHTTAIEYMIQRAIYVIFSELP